MLHRVIRVLVFVAAVFSAIILNTGSAVAVTPQRCEVVDGQVDFTLHPPTPTRLSAPARAN